MYIRKLEKQIICNFDEPIVRTKVGKIKGVISDGTYVFRGIQSEDCHFEHITSLREKDEGAGT